MQPKLVAVLATMFATVMATPTPEPVELAVRAVLEKRGCSWEKCVASLAPSVASCAAAAAEEGANIWADFSCVASASNIIENHTACKGCHAPHIPHFW